MWLVAESLKQRQRQRDRQTDRQRHRETHRQREEANAIDVIVQSAMTVITLLFALSFCWDR